METSAKTQKILERIRDFGTKLGDLRKIANEIKKDHTLALELWSAGIFKARMLAILIMDQKMLTADFIDQLLNDITNHEQDEKLQLSDWLMANQLAKDKKTIALIESWEKSTSSLKLRIFWYHQGRLRWVGQPPPDNTAYLLSIIAKKISEELPEVQWAMNFTAGWIGVFDKVYREQCISIGENSGLYKNDKVSKGCTPNYLPEFIEIESRKRNL